MGLVLLTMLLVSVFGFLIYLGFDSRTDWWLETSCTLISSRVVETRVSMGVVREPIIMYCGEYGLEYMVNGHEYVVWADAGWVDQDREFVENKVSGLSGPCRFRVKYNPLHPAQAMARAQ
jgi:hypothetical protein